jgi:hypothetical protein
VGALISCAHCCVAAQADKHLPARAAAASALAVAEYDVYEAKARSGLRNTAPSVFRLRRPLTHACALTRVSSCVRTPSVQTWFWRWRPEEKARVRVAQARAAVAATAAAAAEAEWAKHARAAKGALGVWSDAGVREARKEFWCALLPVSTTTTALRERAPFAHLLCPLSIFRASVSLFHRRRAYEGGKVFAQRHTFYDIFFAVLSGRTEENTFSFVVK